MNGAITTMVDSYFAVLQLVHLIKLGFTNKIVFLILRVLRI